MQMDANAISIYIVIALFYLVVWGGLIFALQKTKHLRVKQRKSKYSPFSREMQYAVSLTHLTADRYQWVKIQVENSSSGKRYHATKKLEEADEKLKLARQSLADDNLLGSNQACEAALKLIDDAEQDIAG
jgi:hypothetical protein